MNVKKLQWNSGFADTPFNTYMLQKTLNGQYYITSTGMILQNTTTYKTKEEAKEAAQTDFENRIKECIDG